MNKFIAITALLASLSSLGAISTHEEWKGQPYPNDFSASALMGIAPSDGAVGLGIVGAFGFKIMNRGFVSDMNNQLFLEGQAGAALFSGMTGFLWSAHLRWDFHKNEDLSLYALGGLGGIAFSRNLTTATQFYPRFGIGLIWNAFDAIGIRVELSRELIGAGVSFIF